MATEKRGEASRESRDLAVEFLKTLEKAGGMFKELADDLRADWANSDKCIGDGITIEYEDGSVVEIEGPSKRMEDD